MRSSHCLPPNLSVNKRWHKSILLLGLEIICQGVYSSIYDDNTGHSLPEDDVRYSILAKELSINFFLGAPRIYFSSEIS
jgi:hypothetical protein